jgi:uncharacterized cupredoxin-like copper-binding protein
MRGHRDAINAALTRRSLQPTLELGLSVIPCVEFPGFLDSRAVLTSAWMRSVVVSRRLILLATAVAGLALAGCGSGNSTGSAMMGGGGRSTASTGAGMMGGGAGYHFAHTTCSAPRSLPGRSVNVTMADMGMTRMIGGTAPLSAHMMLRVSPATIPAGQISVVASNLGWRTHELVILPLAAGAAAGQRVPGGDGKVAETGSLGEASHSCGSGTGEGITSGTVSWTTVTLPPGRYELICNLPNHYADGMHQAFVVT